MIRQYVQWFIALLQFYLCVDIVHNTYVYPLRTNLGMVDLPIARRRGRKKLIVADDDYLRPEEEDPELGLPPLSPLEENVVNYMVGFGDRDVRVRIIDENDKLQIITI